MESLPLQNLFQSKMYPSEEPSQFTNKESRNKKNDVHPITDKLDFYANRVREVMPKSACCKERSGCVTIAAKPLLIAFQLLAIFPVTFRKKSCRFTHAWCSFPSAVNIITALVTIFCSVTVFTLSATTIAQFRGTDLYTITLVMVSQFAATFLVFATGNFCAPNFCKGWQGLHDVANELEVPNYKVIKHYLWFVPVALLFEGSISAITVSAHVGSGKFQMLVSPYIAFFASMLANVIPNFITFSFAVILWICTYFFESLNQSISACLDHPLHDFLPATTTAIGIYPQDHASKLAKLRQTHEDLCEAVRLLEKAFGFQLLVIFPATALRFIAGIYAILTDVFGLTQPGMQSFVATQGLASILAGFRIMIVILSADALMTKATGALRSLKRARCPSSTDELNEEIDVFLSKLGSFPLEIKCCSIITLNLSFLSGAIPNVITYVLVLMQFKQGDENSNACPVIENATNCSSSLSFSN